MLDLRQISVFRGRAQVLRAVSLTVQQAEAVCLVGRNGAGKTTTMDSIMGLLPVKSGRITLGERDITRVPAHARARLGVGYSPEDAGIFPDLTVAENLHIGQWLGASRGRQSQSSGADVNERIFAVFPEVRAFIHRRGLNLSGGQKKMVAIARAMALAPSILLLDEPFEGLAPVVVSRFIEAVTKVKAMGISLLIAESNLSTATRVADRLYAIDRGEVIFEGAPRSVLQNEEVMKTLRG
ncbi:MAG: ABC transporter ATP-binding protein [Candidatus Rokubacteria bacterium]|nr:ABC transporter ATP-binding protein [Candidatus Rokubacteria bacterium]